MIQAVKNMPAMQKTWVLSLGQVVSLFFPGEWNGHLLQYSCLENSIVRGVLAGFSPWGH